MFKFLQPNAEKKESPVNQGYFSTYNLSYDKKDKKTLAEEGYCQNVIVYRAIREIVTGMSSVTIQVKNEKDEIVDIPKLNKLFKKPNTTSGYKSFIKSIFTDYLINGEMFIAKYPQGSGQPTELWPINPSDMTVKPGKGSIPSAYVYMEKTQNEKAFEVNPLDGSSDMFFMKSYNPCNFWRGLAPLEAAALSGDTHNAGMIWNYSLLKNGARPSGILEFEDSPSGETLGRIKEFFKRQIQGYRNAGEIPILTGGAKWNSVDNSPRDMDYLNTMKENTKYIASAFGVPLPLIDNDAASYNNMEQAKERLWTDTIIPLLDEFLEAFGEWLLKPYGDNLYLCADLDSVPALEGARTRKFDRMVDAANKGVITIDEAREAIGFEPIGGSAGSLLIPSTLIPIDFSMDSDSASIAKSMLELGYTQEEVKSVLGDE